jgi:hypothetical protein
VSPAGSAWKALLGRAAGVFTAPSFSLFSDLAAAWVCATGRRTVCSMVAVMDPATRRAHDAYHRLVRAGAFSLEALWSAMVAVVVERLAGDGPVVCYLDDTLFHRAGRKVSGAGSFRDDPCCAELPDLSVRRRSRTGHPRSRTPARRHELAPGPDPRIECGCTASDSRAPSPTS